MEGAGMGTVETIFAVLVTILAAAAVVGGLVYALVWEVCGIRRTLAAYRVDQPAYDPSGRWWRERAALDAPERHP